MTLQPVIHPEINISESKDSLHSQKTVSPSDKRVSSIQLISCAECVAAFVERPYLCNHPISWKIKFQALRLKAWHVFIAVLEETLRQNNQSLQNFYFWRSKEAALSLIWHIFFFYVLWLCSDYENADVGKICGSVSPHLATCPVRE